MVEIVLTRVKTLTRVFEGRETDLLHDSSTFLTYYAGLTHMYRVHTRLLRYPVPYDRSSDPRVGGRYDDP